jgi:DNA repair exonuclease SbcCD ATPase subunit
MLNTLKLKNFRQHTDRVVEFTPGINTIRGANEAGKSAMLDAIQYALFGSRALTLSLEDSVTWGEDLKTMKVEVTLTIDGKAYTFKRSTCGAEVMLDGNVFCTGQKEVSLLATKLLGADGAMAKNLLMASQGAIKGALAQGSAALSSLIEDLAGFSTFDQILEAASSQLALGSPGMLEERLKGATATLAAATESLPPKPDEKAHVTAQIELANKLGTIESSIPALVEVARRTDEAWKAASSLYLKKNELDVNVTRALSTLAGSKKQASALAVEAHRTFDMGTLDILKQRVKFAEDYGKLSTAHKLFLSLPEAPRYSGPIEEYQTARDQFSVDLRTATAELTAINEKTLSAAARRMNHDKCDKCGQDISHLDSVVNTNAEVDAELKVLAPKHKAAETLVAEGKGAVAALDMIRAHADSIQPTLNKIHPYVTLDESTYPATVTWASEVPTDDVPDLVHAQGQLGEAHANVKAIEAAKAKFDLATEQAAAAERIHAAAVKAHAEFEAPDAETIISLTEAKDNAVLMLGAAKGDVLLINQEIGRMQQAYESATAIWSSAHARITDAEKVIADCQKDLDSLAFNNALLKRIRQIRPLVANKLWSTVLASVSVMFSQIRGEESWVTKEKDGFKVNGHTAEGLSGSAKDALGAAIRCTLMRTFLPQCGLLILDEPCAAMSEERTESMLGFLKSVDFQQTLLVSHETVSESIADNLIQL